MKITKKNISQINQTLDKLSQEMSVAFSAQDYVKALAICKKAIAFMPNNVVTPYIDASVCNCYIGNFDESIKYGLLALKKGGNTFSLYDALAHAYGGKHDFENCKQYGKLALDKRNQIFSLQEPIKHNVFVDIPELPAQSNKSRNIVSFSLYGSLPKYCEGAVVNAKIMQEIFPNWQAYFFVDDSVPKPVVDRILAENAIVIYVDEQQKQLPGPMWRFFALNYGDRVLFRDVDSFVSIHEQKLVEAWLVSNKHFHIIRDGATHTELILAGIWGCISKALPKIDDLIAIFLEKPITSYHFADQYFLRDFVWFYAKQSLLSHDSKFDFMDFVSFKNDIDYSYFHIGMTEMISLNAPIKSNDDSIVLWKFKDKQENLLFEYPSKVLSNNTTITIPRFYAKMLSNEELMVSVHIQ